MRVTAENYDALKGFWLAVLHSLHPEMHDRTDAGNPKATLEAFEDRSKSLARKSLESALGDIIEETQHVSLENIRIADAELAAAGLPTLTDVRLLFWTKISKIMALGRIRSEKEYHMLRNVADGMNSGQRRKAWAMIDEYGMGSR